MATAANITSSLWEEGIHGFRISLDGLSATDMANVYDGLRTVIDVLAGLVSQPRNWDSAGKEFTNSGEILDGLMGFLGSETDRIVDALQTVKTASFSDKDRREEVIISHAIHCGNSVAEIAAIAAGLAAAKH